MSKQYYEGWYMKQQQGDDVLAVIPGRSQEEAFIQVISSHNSYYIPFSLDSYHHGQTICIDNNEFHMDGMRLDIEREDISLFGEVAYYDLSPLKSDIMGPFALLPMETKHSVFSMRHHVKGSLNLNGAAFDFPDGVGYMEGDRGHSFPQGYTWIQSVDFDKDASVMVAIATIPLGPIHFTGCISVVYLDGIEYRFATYSGVKIVHNEKNFVEIQQGDMNLQVSVLEEKGHKLQAPVLGSMKRPIHESPAIPAHFRFTKNDQVLLDQTCCQSSFEHVL